MARGRRKTKGGVNPVTGTKTGTMGLYGGEAGEYAAGQDPEKYVNTLLAQTGVGSTSGGPTEYDEWLRAQRENYGTQLLENYGIAQAADQELTLPEWFQNQYGASYGYYDRKGKGKKQWVDQFTPGSLGTDVEAGDYTAWSRERNPEEHYLSRLDNSQMTSTLEGMAQANYPVIYGKYLDYKQTQNPDQTWSDFMAGVATTPASAEAPYTYTPPPGKNRDGRKRQAGRGKRRGGR